MTRLHIIAKPLVIGMVFILLSTWIFQRDSFWTPQKREEGAYYIIAPPSLQDHQDNNNQQGNAEKQKHLELDLEPLRSFYNRLEYQLASGAADVKTRSSVTSLMTSEERSPLSRDNNIQTQHPTEAATTIIVDKDKTKPQQQPLLTAEPTQQPHAASLSSLSIASELLSPSRDSDSDSKTKISEASNNIDNAQQQALPQPQPQSPLAQPPPPQPPQPQPAAIFRTPVTLSQIDRRFCLKTRDSCDDDCRCADNLSDAKTVADWEEALKNDKIKGKSLFKSYEYVFDWEKDYLSKPPLKYVKDLPDLQLSKVWYLTHDDRRPVMQNRVVSKKYQPVSFRVDLVNRYGIQRSLGGDEVRVWIQEDPSTRSKKRYAASGFVKDYGNGSYVATVTPMWTGLTHLYIAVVYPREYIRAALHHARLGSNRFILGLFKRQNVEEVTLCHSTPNVPGRSCSCNFTSWNTVPFYCGRPVDKWLTCNDWVSVWPASQPPFKHLTYAEEQLAERMSRTANKSLIQHRIAIDVIDTEADNDPILEPCSNTDPRLTWEKTSPRGYWTYGPKWTSLICKEPELTPTFVKECLRSTHVWLIGDSNIVRVRMMLCTLLSCKYVPHYTKWPDSLLGRNEQYNVSVIFRPHEHPLYLRLEWMSLYLNGGIRTYLQSVPSTGKHVVVIHYYLHLASSHLGALYYRLVNLRESLRELFHRNDEVLVGIRGPHISTVQWQYNHMFGGDVTATFMIRMLHEVMEEFKSRVVFLDGWDMSIGIRNAQLHPSNSIPTAMIRTMLAFKCS